MADEDKSGTNLASGSVIFVAVVSAGFYFFHREAPLVDLRPVAEGHVEERTAPQEIEARLWQDPIGAVDKFREKSGAWKSEQVCRDDSGVANADLCKVPVNPRAEHPMVLGVTVPGAPYPEDVERRRRTRYAVLAGLERAGFVPEDRRHIGYFVWTQAPSFAPLLAESRTKLPLLVCDPLPGNPFARVSSTTSSASYCMVDQTSMHVDRTLPHAALREPAIVPYEKFTRVQEPDVTKSYGSPNTTKDAPDSVLVLWLKEDLLKRYPLNELNALVGLLNRDQHPTVKFIGPSSSDMLHEMVNEALAQNDVNCDGPKGHWKNLEGINFYAYLASVPDKYLLGNLYDSTSCTLQIYLKNFVGIHLQRTIATEDAIAQGLRDELALRRIHPSSEVQDHIALISEWDTYYGQTLPKSVEGAFAPGIPEPPWIHKFTYLRGLDGLLPAAGGKEEPKQDKSTAGGDKPGGTPDFFKVEKDTPSLERPIGESQYDYLRRISGRLHKIDDGLRKKEKSIKAIGILGGDVFDKLLILRAMRLEFPEALFFTTDYDEAFRIKSELPFTRNLIISSSFGPNLSEWLQGDIPSFRDTGETSAFLATQLAVGRLPQDLEKPSAFPPDLSTQLRAPRLFEITRTGGILPFAWTEMSAPHELPASQPQNHEPKHEESPKVADTDTHMTQGRSISTCPVGDDRAICNFIQPASTEKEQTGSADKPKSCWTSEDKGSCYIQPVATEALGKPGDPKTIEKLFPTYEKNSRLTLAIGLAAGALVALGALFLFPYLRKHALVEFVLLILGLTTGSLLCFYWEPFAQFVTENGDGAPIWILEGVSVWPTTMLRILGIVLSLYFIYRALRGLNENLKEIAENMELSPIPVKLGSQIIDIRTDIFALWKWLKCLFGFSSRTAQRARNEPLDVEVVWQQYTAQERFWPRICRAAIYASGMTLLFMYILVPMFGKPPILARGELAYDAYSYTGLIGGRLMLFLMFLIFDATLSCLLFVNKLRSRTQWPLATAGIYKGRLELQTNLVHDWIDLEFVAKRTNCIGSLIYFPFIMIALFILTRSSIFANYAPSWTILIWFGISFSIVFGCAVMLWWVARATKDVAKKNLMEGIIREKEAEGDPRLAEQLEALLIRVGQLNEGAFSPLPQQPLVKALLLPLSSAGWVTVIESGLLPGL